MVELFFSNMTDLSHAINPHPLENCIKSSRQAWHSRRGTVAVEKAIFTISCS